MRQKNLLLRLAKIMKISENLLVWYKINQRVLPWRNSSDPYMIWLSEIILQQTRVNQGLSYYIKFAERFPDVRLLAAASEEEVLNLWQGLGYYSRARNMQFAAQQIVKDFDGQFPDTYDQILTLKGVGTYTASAIASIAFGEPVAVVDGNVARVVSRLFAMDAPINSGKGAKQIQYLADEMLERKDAGTYNQAIMEFGALQCVPKNPNCEICPLKDTCLAYEQNTVSTLPIKINKVKIKKRYFNYMVMEHKGYTYIRKRTGDDIWKSLYEFPMFEAGIAMTEDALMDEVAQQLGMDGKNIHFQKISDSVKHQLTHRTIYARFIHVKLKTTNFNKQDDWIKIPVGEIDNYPLSRLIDRYLGA